MKTLFFRAFTLFIFNTLVLNTHSFAQQTKTLRAFMQAAPSPKNAIPYGNNIQAGHYIQSGDAKIYYEVYGKGKPLVVLHGGIFGSAYEMGRFIDSLSKKYMVIAVSTRGHGRSEMGNTEPSYEQKAADVNNILKTVTKDSAIVLGFSDGAYTGYYLAGEFPRQVSKLIAIGAGEWKKGFREFKLTKEAAFALDSLYWKQQLELMPEPNRINEWFSSVSKYYNSLGVGKEVFEKVKCPVLLLAGELDQNAPLQTIIAAYNKLPKAQLGIIPNVPHPAFQINFNAVWADIVPYL